MLVSKWSPKARALFTFEPLGPYFEPTSAQDRPKTAHGPHFGCFWHHFGCFFDAFGMILAQFWRHLGITNSLFADILPMKVGDEKSAAEKEARGGAGTACWRAPGQKPG